jgi:hypothetical protein
VRPSRVFPTVDIPPLDPRVRVPGGRLRRHGFDLRFWPSYGWVVRRAWGRRPVDGRHCTTCGQRCGPASRTDARPGSATRTWREWDHPREGS